MDYRSADGEFADGFLMRGLDRTPDRQDPRLDHG